MKHTKSRIVHVFIGDSSISLMVIENIIRHSACDHFFIVTKRAETQKYRKLFEKYRAENFILCDEVKPSVWSKTITWVSSAILGKFSALLTYLPYDEIRTIFRYRKNPILLHGISFSFMARLLCLRWCRSLSYVCWGYAPKPTGKEPKHKLLHQLLFSVNRSVHRGYKRIVCLTTDDKVGFEKVYGVTTAMTIIYQSDILDYDDPRAIESQPTSGQHKVILGNSACCMESYLKLLPILERFVAPLSITCMLSYPENDPLGKKRHVIEQFASAFGEDFTPWTQQVDMMAYADKMKQHDIYICSMDRQTGLGAIYTMLMYGKKLYLAGGNLSWIRENEFVVKDVKDLETETADAFLTQLCIEERKHNRERLLHMLSPDTLSREWDQFYSQL